MFVAQSNVQCNAQTIKNSSNQAGLLSWRGRRSSGKGYTLSLNALHDADDLTPLQKGVLGIILSHTHNETGAVRMGPARLAEWTDKSSSQAKRYLRDLVELGYLTKASMWDEENECWGESIYWVNLRPQKRAEEIHAPVEVPAKNDPTPGVINDPVVLINYSSLKTETQTTPQAAEEVCVSPSRSEAPKPEPRRHEHHHPPKQRPCRPILNAFQVAAVEVMRLCGVVETNWRTRDGIASAIALRVDSCEAMARRCVEDAVIAWKTYLDDVQLLRCPLGIEQFFVQGLWLDRRLWRYDQDVIDRQRRGRW